MASDDIDDDLEERLRETFGETIFSYTDEQAVDDGMLVPFCTSRGDTGHRITRNAYATLREHHRNGYPAYSDAEFLRFFFAELLPLIPTARTVYGRRGILKTTYDFRVVEQQDQVLWYLPNENDGVTIMLPEDY